MPSPTYRGSQQSGDAGTPVNPLSVGFGSIPGLAAGDTVIIDVEWSFNGTTMTLPTGWSWNAQPAGGSGNQLRRIYKQITSGELTTGSVSVAFSGSARAVATAHAYAGAVVLGTAVTNLSQTIAPAVVVGTAGSDVLTAWGTSIASGTPGTVAFANGTLTQNPATGNGTGSNMRLSTNRLTTSSTGSQGAGATTVTGGAAATTQGVATEIIAGATPGSVTYSMAGAARSDRCMVLGKLSGATSVRLGVSTDPTHASGVTFQTAQTPDANGEVRFDVTGLAADTKYYYRFYDTPSGGSENGIGSGLGSTTSGVFRTRPSAGGTSDVKIALGSCCLTATAQSAVAFDDAVTWDPHYVLHLGDAYYNGNTANTLASQHRTLWETQIAAVAKWKAMLGGTAVDYINSDHELNPDDTDTNTTNAASFNDFYKATIPARLVDTATSPAGKYRSWIDSGIRFILIDIRTTDRSPGANTDNSAKTMLGATQKAWLKKELLDGDGTPTILKVLISDVPFFANTGVDKWSSSYNTELSELLNFAVYNGINLDLLHGDSHRLAVDAGSHNAWGLPVICGSPFSQNGGGAETNGLWDAMYDNAGAAVSQYMRLTYSRPTADSVQRVASGWDAIAATQRVSQTKTWTRKPAPGADMLAFA